MGSNDGRIEHFDKMRRFAKRREGFEEGHEDTALAQAPKTFRDAIPETEFGGQGAPSDVVDREIMKRFEKLTVVAALVTPPRATSSKNFEHDRPIFFGHPGQHGRSSTSRPPMNH
jgi:hypothetical protein